MLVQVLCLFSGDCVLQNRTQICPANQFVGEGRILGGIRLLERVDGDDRFDEVVCPMPAGSVRSCCFDDWRVCPVQALQAWY